MKIIFIGTAIVSALFMTAAGGERLEVVWPPSSGQSRTVRLEPEEFHDSYVFKGYYRMPGTGNGVARFALDFLGKDGKVLSRHAMTLPGTGDEFIAFFDEYGVPAGSIAVQMEVASEAGAGPVFRECSLRPGRLQDYGAEFFPELPPDGARFPIFGWCPPGTGKGNAAYRDVQELYGSDRVFAEYSYANFTVWGDPVFGAMRHAASKAVLARQADTRELWAVVGKDEPVPGDFPKHLAEKEEIGRLLPGVPYFNNLLPCHAGKVFESPDAYIAYLKQYRDQFRPRFVTADIYVLRDKPPVYYRQFWNQLYDMQSVFGDNCDWGMILQALHFGSMRSPTEAELRFQAYSALAFGAKILGWFTFLEPIDRKLLPAADAAIQRDGNRSFHYPMLRRLNREVLTLGSLLLKLRCVGTRLVPTPSRYQRYRELPRPGDAVVQAEGGKTVIGEFVHSDGGRFVLLVNRDFMKPARLVFTLNRQFSGLREISRGYPAEMFSADNANRVAIDFAPGDGRLFQLLSSGAVR